MGPAVLTLDQIKTYFPESVYRRNPQGALVEYLQHELLDSLFKEPGSRDLAFIGGTCIRILHQSVRFSEDLDFDNFGLSFEEFESLLIKTCRDMEYKGFIIEYSLKERAAFHCHIRFPELLFKTGISPDRGKKILISVDTEIKERNYAPLVSILNRFTVFRRIIAAPLPVLMAQKMMAVIYRPREKGRDLFDLSFLIGLTRPDFAYIEKSLGVEKHEFIHLFESRLDQLDLDFLARDVEPFLFEPNQKERVLFFRETWKKVGDSHPDQTNA